MKRWKVLGSLMQNPKEIITLGYQALMRKRNDVNYEKELQQKYDRTILPTIDLLDLIPGFNEQIINYTFLTHTSLVTDILMLKGLARQFKDCAFLEIGSLRGESLASVADVAKECVSITLSEQEMRDMGFDESYINVHGLFSKDKHNITTYRSNSHTFDFSMLKTKFDLIFIDCDHSYNGVLLDTQNVFKLLKDENSMVVWHDYGINVEEVRHEVLAAIMDGTPADLRSNLYHVSNTMCAIFTRKTFETTLIRNLSYPNKVFQVEVKASKLQ